MTEIKTMCPQCDGEMLVEMQRWPSRAVVKVKCQSCEGKGYVVDELPD